MGKALADYYLAGVKSHAIGGEAVPVGHAGALEGLAFGQAVGEVGVAVGHFAVGINELAVAAGFVVFILFNDWENTGGGLVAVGAGGNRPVHGNASIHVQAGALLRYADDQLGVCPGYEFEQGIICIALQGERVFFAGGKVFVCAGGIGERLFPHSTGSGAYAVA